jgi:hypothetical protein
MVCNWEKKLRTVRKEEVARNGEEGEEVARNCEEGKKLLEMVMKGKR